MVPPVPTSNENAPVAYGRKEVALATRAELPWAMRLFLGIVLFSVALWGARLMQRDGVGWTLLGGTMVVGGVALTLATGEFQNQTLVFYEHGLRTYGPNPFEQWSIRYAEIKTVELIEVSSTGSSVPRVYKRLMLSTRAGKRQLLLATLPEQHTDKIHALALELLREKGVPIREDHYGNA